MSIVSTVVTERHFRYVAERTAPEDEFLRRLKEAAQGAGIPPIWIAPDPKDREVEAIRTFNDIMAATATLHGVIVPLGDGLWVAVRR